MTAPAISLCSQALRLLGEVELTSFDEGTSIANTASLLYPSTLRGLLAAHPWRFTLRKARLVQVTTPPINEWRFAHALPADALAIRAIFTSGTPGAMVSTAFELFEGQVFSDHAELWADYQFEPDAALFPAYFHELAQAALAAKFAMPVGAGVTAADYWHRRAFGGPAEAGAGGLMGQARRLDSQQQPPQSIHNFPLIAARFGGRGTGRA